MTASVEIRPVVGYDGVREAATAAGCRGANPVIARRMESLRAGQRREPADGGDDGHPGALTGKKA